MIITGHNITSLFLNLTPEVPGSAGAAFTYMQVSLFIFMILLGVVLFLFMLYNFKNNFRWQPRGAAKSILKKNSPAQPLTLPDTRFLDIHPVPTCICTHDGIITYCNSSFNLVFGEAENHLNGLNLLNILPSYLSEILTNDFNNLKQSRSRGYTSQGFLSPRTKYRYQTRWQLLPKDLVTGGELMITLEKMQESELINQSIDEPLLLLRQVLDNSPIPTFIEDYKGVILEVNKAACQLQQFNRDELIGRSITELHPFSNHDQIIERQKLMTHLDTFSFKSVTYTKLGKPVPVEVFVNRTNFFGTPALFFLVHDLTDHIEASKQLEEYKIKADESDRLKSSFLANLSHEVRTPMNSIMGFAELLAETNIEPRDRVVFINIIRQSGKELLTQINNMIDFSKIEAGLIRLKVEICRFDLLFSNLKEVVGSIPGSKPNVRLFFDLPLEMAETSIATDFSRLYQILQVLLHNSIKYTKIGVIEVGVRVKAPQLFEFYVRDTGIGISDEKHRQIFEKFRQVNDSNSREFSGMGLGLSVAARLIQFLGGHQWVTSESLKGTEFKFVLPDLLQPQDSPYMQVSCGPSTALNKIMVIAPSEEFYNDLSQNAKPVNYQVFWAQNALEMKSMIMSNKFLYILIAVDQLPFWPELLPQIKKVETSAQLIGISDKMDFRRAKHLMSMGLSDAIQSPGNISTLINLIEKNELSPIKALTSSISHN